MMNLATGKMAHLTRTAVISWERYWATRPDPAPMTLAEAVEEAVVVPPEELVFRPRLGATVFRSPSCPPLLLICQTDTLAGLVVVGVRVGGWEPGPELDPQPEPPVGLDKAGLMKWIGEERRRIRQAQDLLSPRHRHLYDSHLARLNDCGRLAETMPSNPDPKYFTPQQRARSREFGRVTHFIRRQIEQAQDPHRREALGLLLMDLEGFLHRPPNERTHHVPDAAG